MAIEVPDNIKKETNRCPHDLACLATVNSGNQLKCKVNYSNGKNVLFVVPSEEHLSCPYLIFFGNGRICTCPVHYYLCNNKAIT